MPGGDGTGPMGMGPLTGRGAGYCAGYSVPGYMNLIPGRGVRGGGRGGGWGRGVGFGRGLGLGFRGGRGRTGWWGAVPYAAAPGYPPPYWAPGAMAPTPEQERDALQGQVEYLEDALEGLRKRIAELEVTKGEPKQK